MRLITVHCLIINLILSVSYLTPASAVTDAELEALEKQIEQQEAEAKKQAEEESKKKAAAEVKRKEDQKRKLEAEAKRRKEEEVNRIAEEEAKKKAEEARLAEIERQRQEDENKKKAEEAKQKQFSQHMKNADSAMNNKEFTEALQNYTQALEIFPSNPEALTGQSRAREFQDLCAVLVGEWDYAFVDNTMIATADGKVQFIAIIPNHGRWECTDPSQRIFTLYWEVGGWVDTVTLSADGNTLDGVNNIGFGFQGFRKGTKKMDPSREVPL